MAKRLQLRGGTTAQNNAFTGAARELTVDTDTWSLRLHDGETAGGKILSDWGHVTGNLVPSANVTYDLGSLTHQWRSLYVSGNTIYLGGTPISVSNNGNLLINGNSVIVTGNVKFNDTTVFNLSGLNIENSDLSHGFTARLQLPANGSSNAVIVQNNYGNVTVTSGVDIGNTKTWRFGSNGVLTLPIGGNILNSDGSTLTTLDYLELTNDAFIFEPYAGPLVSFTKTNGGNEVDAIDTSIAITRGNNQGIYNPLLETQWDDTSNDGASPTGTLWNNSGWGDLTNLNQRTYYSFYEAFLGQIGNNILAAEPVMKDVANNKYYKFDFTVWGASWQGAPVTYTRTQIDPVTGDTIGSPVEFIKVGSADPTLVNDPIDTNLTLARGNNQGLYNIALETNWSTVGDAQDSPEGTLWNNEGWNNLRNVRQRTYDTFLSTLGYAIGENILNKELVMHDTVNDKFYAIKFSSWTAGGNGGGFSYTRQLINTDNFFEKLDYGDQVDILVEDDGAGSGIGITRGENQALYNPYREEGWDSDISPAGTLWNIEGWDDLSNLTTRNYTTFYSAFGNGGLGNKIPGSKCIVYLPDTNQYFAIHFLSWTQNNNGGGFSYLRYEIDTTQLNEGIRFADNTLLKTAEGLGRVKSTASGSRRIEEVTGNKTVSVTAIGTTNLTTTLSRAVSNNNSIYIDVSTSNIDNIMENPSAYGITNYNTIQFSLDNSTWYTWAGSTGYTGTERSYSLQGNPQLTYNQGDTVYFRYTGGGAPQVWWDKNDLPGGSTNFRGAVIDYHAYTGEATFIGTIHIVSDTGSEHITHTEVSSGDNDSENDDLWLVENEGTISYRRIDGEAKTLKVHWTAKVFYGSEFWD